MTNRRRRCRTQGGHVVWLVRIPREVGTLVGFLLIVLFVLMMVHEAKESMEFNGQRSVDGLTIDMNSMHYVHGDGSTYELGYGYVTGTITNTSGHALDNADVRLDVRNPSNDELAYAEARYADDHDLGPMPAGTVWHFKATIGDSLGGDMSKADHVTFDDMSAEDAPTNN